jgi:hypothetical protein
MTINEKAINNISPVRKTILFNNKEVQGIYNEKDNVFICERSKVKNSILKDCTIIRSHISKSYLINTTVVDSDLSNCLLSFSKIKNSHIGSTEKSTIEYSYIRDSKIVNIENDLRHANIIYCIFKNFDLFTDHYKLISDIRLIGPKKVNLKQTIDLDCSYLYKYPELGIRRDSLIVYRTKQGVYVKTGCFHDTLEEFEKAVWKNRILCFDKEYIKVGIDYLRIIKVIKNTL